MRVSACGLVATVRPNTGTPTRMRRYEPLNDALDPARPSDAVLIEYGRKAVIEERRSFDGHFDEALRLVRERRCYSMTDLASRFGHTSAWATRFKEAVMSQGLMSLDEFAMCFQRRRDGRGRPICNLNGISINEQQTKKENTTNGNDHQQDDQQGSREAVG
jgi:hypothetical protein